MYVCIIYMYVYVYVYMFIVYASIINLLHYTIPPLYNRIYAEFKAKMGDIRDVICWNENYEHVLHYIQQMRKTTTADSIDNEGDHLGGTNHTDTGGTGGGTGGGTDGSSSTSLTAEDRDADDSKGELDSDDDSIHSEAQLLYDERFLYNMKRRWMNTTVIIMRRKGLQDDDIKNVFHLLLPYY